MHKLALGTLLALSSTTYSVDTLQEAILNSDYEVVAQQYNAQETPESIQHAYWALADDTAKMRSTNLAFDWAKAFISKKLLISIFLLESFAPLATIALRDYINKLIASRDPTNKLLSSDISKIFDFTAVACFSISFTVFVSALLDGNKYYNQLQDKIKDAERIKFLITAQN